MAAYEAARAVAQQNLALGLTVVVDAVNDSEPARDTWRAAAAATGTDLVFVVLSLEDAVEHRRRLAARARGLENVPEPSWDDVTARAATYAPWAEDGCLRVDARGPVEDLVAELAGRLAGEPPA